MGSGKVQSASGVILALLEQLCAQMQTFPSCLDDDLTQSPIVKGKYRDVDNLSLVNRESGVLEAESSANPVSQEYEIKMLHPESQNDGDSGDAQGRSHGFLTQNLDDTYPSGQDQPYESLTGHVLKSSKQRDYASGDATDDEKNESCHDNPIPESVESRPDLELLLRALHDTCQSITPEFQLFIVFDAWDEQNMDLGIDFRYVLDTLLENSCKIFISSRVQYQPCNISPDETAMEIDIAASLETSDIEKYVQKMLQGHCPTLSGCDIATATQKIMEVSLGM
jgi:hypothetical protein